MSTNDLEQPNFHAKRIIIDDSDDDTGQVNLKRRKTSNIELEDGWWRKPSEIKLSHDDYTVGWICALPIELAASHAMLDEVHENLSTVDNDTNAYILGSIGGHNVSMACLPSDQYGTNNAATVAGNMMRSFKYIRFGFMVGIGGGVPGNIDIRLGDIVVGNSVVQHDLGKIMEGNEFQGTGTPRIPPRALSNAVSKLRAIHEANESQIMIFLREMRERYPKLADYAFPASCEDHLFRAKNHHEHDHSGDHGSCSFVELCHRPSRNSNHPLVHYGGIASGNQVIKCGQRRDELAKERNVICFEMEAAGLSDVFPCIVIRGICDYADSQKNKQWQKYAAATAAAYAKELISVIAPSGSRTAYSSQGLSSEHALNKTPQAVTDRRKTLLDSLRFEQIDARHATIKKAYSKTCEWLLSDSSYKQWLDPSCISEHHGFLWISGKPGAGKSTIMKFAYDRAHKKPGENIAISFFFNARGDTLEKSTLGLYRSLLLQLLESFPDLQSVLDGSTPFTTKKIRSPTIDGLQSLLRNAVARVGSRQITCFIDALDECDEVKVRDMVVFFEDLGEEAAENGIKLRICFSSRHYPHVDIRHGLKLILEDHPGHGKDMESYISRYLRADEDDYVDSVRTKILTKSGGVFMWVVLVVQLLNAEFIRGRRAGVEKRLNEVPTGLSDLFRDILKRDDANMKDLLLCIQWVLFAKRPLTPKEFYFAMHSGLPELQQEPSVHDTFYETDETICLFVTGSSKGLAEITKSGTATVQFIHESVKDFLLKDGGLQELWSGISHHFEGLSHQSLTTCCLSYITVEVMSRLQLPSIVESLPKAKSSAAREMRQRSADKYPFLAYACQNVLFHAELITSKSCVDDFLDHFPLQIWIHINDSLERHSNRRYPLTISLAYILAERGFHNLLRKCVRGLLCYDIKGGRYGYPIFAALANKHWAAVNVLLGQMDSDLSEEELFCPVNYQKQFDSPRTQDSYPLHWAIKTSHFRVAELMISSGRYECLALDSAGRSPLHWAAIAGNGALMKVLLEKILSLHQRADSPEGSQASVICMSTEDDGTSKVACMRAYLNQPDISGNTVLSLACTGLEEDVIRVLLEFDTDFSDCCGRIKSIKDDVVCKLNKWLAAFLIDKISWTRINLLFLAVLKGNEEVAELILDSEECIYNVGDFDAVNFDRANLLEQVAADGNLAMVKLLLKKGVAVGLRRWNAGKLLYRAVATGDEASTKFLVDNGALVVVQDSLGDSPLKVASMNGHKTVVEFLLQSGEYVDRRGRDRGTSLHAASFAGHVDVVKLLLAKGACVDATDEEGQRPLHDAVLGGHEAVARILLAEGSSLHCSNSLNQTPVTIASLHGPDTLRKFLQEESTKMERARLRLQSRTEVLLPRDGEQREYIIIDDDETSEPTEKGSRALEVIEIESTDDES